MHHKTIITIATGLAALLGVIAVRQCALPEGVQTKEPPSRNHGKTHSERGLATEDGGGANSVTPTAMVLEPRGATPAPAERPPTNHILSTENDLGVIRDKVGRIVVVSNRKNIGIRVCRESPDGLRAVVAEVDGVYALIGSAGEPLVKLPSPPTEGDLASECYWLDNSRLLVVSADARRPPPGQSPGEEPDVTKTRLFAYQLANGLFSEIPTGSRIPVPVFTVIEARDGGIIHIVQDGTDKFPSDLGWFDIREAQ
jgi:hypothetical protein